MSCVVFTKGWSSSPCYWGSAQTLLSCASEFIYGFCFLLCQFRVSGFTYAYVFDSSELRFAEDKRYRFILLQATISQLEGLGQISVYQVAGASLVGSSWDPMSTTDGHRGGGCQAVVRLGDLNGERLGRESG